MHVFNPAPQQPPDSCEAFNLDYAFSISAFFCYLRSKLVRSGDLCGCRGQQLAGGPGSTGCFLLLRHGDRKNGDLDSHEVAILVVMASLLLSRYLTSLDSTLEGLTKTFNVFYSFALQSSVTEMFSSVGLHPPTTAEERKAGKARDDVTELCALLTERRRKHLH